MGPVASTRAVPDGTLDASPGWDPQRARRIGGSSVRWPG